MPEESTPDEQPDGAEARSKETLTEMIRRREAEGTDHAQTEPTEPQDPGTGDKLVELVEASEREDDAVPPRSPGERIVRIFGKGSDPLVAGYIEEHQEHCAYRILSGVWLLIGILACIIGGLIGDHLAGQPAPLDLWASGERWVVFAHLCLGNPGGVVLGMLGGALTAATAGSIIGSRGMPTSHEPLIVLPFMALVYAASYDWLLAVSAITGLVCLLYLVVISYRVLALLLGGARGLHTADPQEPADGWPVYTVLVPLYKETAVASKIMKHLSNLDYPRSKLDVKLLLEADDPDTLAAIEAAGIPHWAEVVVVPDAQPKTKPRACNHGLQRARGEFLVIYDAEDQPQHDQLKQAVCAFAKVPAKVACIQAQLAYRNHDQNLLTKCFTMEYNVWFRRYLRGLVRLAAPIPLGGTSNHFRTAVLREFSGWDPFNVTEDCDLGIRLHAHGHRTAILESVTWEEANSRVGNWIRQRSRWLKGYLITHVVWWRRPLRLLRSLNPWGVVGFSMAVFGVAGLAVLNLPLWIALGTYLVLLGIDVANGHDLWWLLSDRGIGSDRLSWPMLFLGPDEDPRWARLSLVFFVASAVLLVANLFFILVNAAFGRRPRQHGLLLAALLSPFYWLLMSIAGWKGLWQMIVRPHYWEKTVHGLEEEAEGGVMPSQKVEL